MKWFRHDSNASLDAKLQRLKLKYGMEGYGLYWHLLECVARNVESHNLTFELEEDVELIAAATNIHYERVQEMMVFMCDQGLFENTDGRVTCLKMATRTDEYTQKLMRNPANVRTLSRHTPDKVPPNRIEEKIIDRREEKDPPSTGRKRPYPANFSIDDSMTEWVTKKFPDLDYPKATDEWVDYCQANGRKFVDWRRAWQSAMRKAEQWRLERESKCGTSASHEELMEAIADL